MQKVNSDQLKRDCFIALLIPVSLFSLVQVGMRNTWETWCLVGIAASGVIWLGCHMYKFFNRLENITWQEQLASLVQKVTTPVLIADVDNEIVFSNNSFNRLPLSTIKLRYQNLCELLVSQSGEELDISKRSEKILEYRETLDNLTSRMKIQFENEDASFEWVLLPLFSPMGRRWGTLVECDFKKASQEVFLSEHVYSQDDKIISQAVSQAIHPLVILDEEGKIKEVNPAMIRMFEKNSDMSLSTDEFKSKHFIDWVEVLFPSIFPSFSNALLGRETSIFIAEHHGEYYDWLVKPFQEKGHVLGFFVEIIYPSKQMHLGVEESLDRLNTKRQSVEKELKQFTNSLSKLNLYQKEPEFALEEFDAQYYRHPLLRHSVKNLGSLARSLKKIHDELDEVKVKIDSGAMVEKTTIITTPLHEVNVLSSSIARNVQEIQYDFNAIDKELGILKNLVKEHKALNQAYLKPIQSALHSTQRVLFQTLSHSETVTLVVHQLHEIYCYLGKLQEQIMGHLSINVRQDILALLESIKHDLLGCKMKLCEMISEYERLKESWREASESLASCLHISENVEQASEHWNESGDLACEYSIQVERHLQRLFSLTEKLQSKTASMEHLSPTQVAASAPEVIVRNFDQVIIEIEENKRRAEDVLLEGIKKQN